MSAYNGLPKVVLSKKRARYLMARNAGEKEIFRKKCLLLEEARTKNEKAFEREKELLLQRHSKTLKTQEARRAHPYGEFNSASKTTPRIEGKNKWEINSDTPLYTQQRRNQEFLLNSKRTLSSSHESIFCLSTNNSTRNSGEVYDTTTPGEDSLTKVRSLSCVLPPIAPFSYPHSAESKTRKQMKSVCLERRNTRV